jgi:two-component system response regulator AtoC
MLFSAAALPPEAPDASMWRALHSVALPPLRERRGDIPLLVQHAVETIRKESGKYLTGVESDALHALTGLDWPGNVPQLRQAIETAAISATGPVITLPDLAAAMPHLIPGGGAGGTLHFHVGQSLYEIERTAILQTLETLGGDKQKTARVLGIGRKTLYRKLDRYRTDGALPENRSRHASRSRND